MIKISLTRRLRTDTAAPTQKEEKTPAMKSQRHPAIKEGEKSFVPVNSAPRTRARTLIRKASTRNGNPLARKIRIRETGEAIIRESVPLWRSWVNATAVLKAATNELIRSALPNTRNFMFASGRACFTIKIKNNIVKTGFKILVITSRAGRICPWSSIHE